MPDQNILHNQTASAADWQARFDVAEGFFTAGSLAEAEAAYQEVMASMPDFLPAYIGAMRCARQRADRLASLALLDAAMSLDPDNIGVQVERAADLLTLQRFDEAAAGYKAVLDVTPKHVQAWLGLGQCARQRGDRPAAMAIFQDAAASVPEDPWPLVEIATEYRALRQWDEAEASYAKVLLIARETVQAWLGLGYCARQRGNRHISFALFQAGSIANPGDPWPLVEMGADLRELGLLAQAADIYRRALQLAPGNVQAHLGLAHCARRQGDRLAAIEHAREAIRVGPDDLWPRIELAADLRELGQLAAAETEYRHVLSAAPGNMQAQLGLGVCARKRGDRPASMAIFQAAAASAPADPWPHIELALDLRELQNFAAADAAYATALAIAPGNVQALLGLGLSARLRGERAAAIEHFTAAAQANAHEPWPWLEIAAEQREAGDPDAAIATAKQVLARHENHFNAMLSIGLSERCASRHEAAYLAFSAAHRAHPAQAEPLVEMAVAARVLGHQPECDDLLARAQALDPRNVAVICRLGEQAAFRQDHAEAYAIYETAALDQPGQLAFHLGIADALAALGKSDEAMAKLAALESAQGMQPASRGKQINLLRQAGDYQAALGLARASIEAVPHDFYLWSEWFHSEMVAGTRAEITRCLAACPAATAQQQAVLHRHEGQFAETCWRFTEALEAYETAASANPDDAWMQQDLVRLKTLLLDLPGAVLHLKRFCALTAYETRLRKKSVNISQTQYGQILDEYRLDAEVVAAVRTLFTMPLPEQISGLGTIVQTHPDSTVAAVALMMALRQDGAFMLQPAGAGVSGRSIPRSFMQYWDEAVPPADVARLMESWRAANPDYTFHLFNDRTAQDYLARHYPPPVLHAYRRGEYG